MEIKIIDRSFSVCKVTDYSLVDLNSEFVFSGKTDEEHSLVCVTENVPENVTERDDGWRAFRLQGILDFSMIGVLAKISGILADKGIALFAVSTYNTDYIMVKEEKFSKAVETLKSVGYEIIR